MALYRVSTEDQAVVGTSLVDQAQRCKAYATALAWSLIEEITEDGVSAALPESRRPGLARLMRLCRQGLVDVVLITDVDRLSRNLLSHLSVNQELEDLGVRLLALNSPDMGELERNIRGVFAQEERRRIAERTSAGHRRMVEMGFWPAGAPPYGFRLVPDGAHKRLVIHEPEADVIRQAVTWIVDDGCSYQEVCRRLNAMDARPQRAPVWRVGHLRRRLLSPHLSGVWTWAKSSKMGHPPIGMSIPEILSTDSHVALLDALARKATGPRPRSNQRVYPLSGRLVGLCGHEYTGVFRNDRGGRAQYRCKCAQGRSAEVCTSRRVEAEPIEAVVWKEVVNLLSHRDRLAAMAREFLDLRAAGSSREREQAAVIETKLAQTKRARSRLLVAWAKEETTAEAMREAVAEIDSELAVLALRRASLTAWEDTSARQAERARRILDLAEYARSEFPLMEPARRAEIVGLLNIRVTVEEHPQRSQPTRLLIEGEVLGSLLVGSDSFDGGFQPASRDAGDLAIPFGIEAEVS